jgi:hypothetical protein
MATLTFFAQNIDADRTPKVGYSAVGKNGSGENREAAITFPPLDVEGAVLSATVALSWDNAAAGEGFPGTAAHELRQSADTHYVVSGDAGSVLFALADYSRVAPFTAVLRGDDGSPAGSGKSYVNASIRVVVEFDPGLEGNYFVRVPGGTALVWKPVAGLSVFAGGTWKPVVCLSRRDTTAFCSLPPLPE